MKLRYLFWVGHNFVFKHGFNASIGPGESGKSTVAKQLRIITNSNPWTDEERQVYKEIIVKNVLKSIRDVIEASQKFEFILQEEKPGHCTNYLEV